MRMEFESFGETDRLSVTMTQATPVGVDLRELRREDQSPGHRNAIVLELKIVRGRSDGEWVGVLIASNLSLGSR